MDCRKQLYDRLTFTFHRAETALDFLKIVPEIKSLLLAIQVKPPRRSEGWDDIPPELPWHCSPNTWISLRDSLAKMDNLRHLSVWVDACSQMAREHLLFDYYDLFIFDPRLEPILRLSKPISDDWSVYYPSGGATPYVVKRGMSHFWQEPTVAPHITFSPWYGTETLYRPARRGGPVSWYPRRRSFREYLSDTVNDASELKSRILQQ